MLEAGDEVEGDRIRAGKCLIDGGMSGGVGSGEKCFSTRFGLGAQIVELNVAKHCRLDSREREQKMRVERGDRRGCRGLGAWRLAAEVELGFDLRKGEVNGEWIAMEGERVDPRTAGIAQAQEFGDFVVGFAGRIVDGATDERVGPCVVEAGGEIEVGVATGDNQGQGWPIGVVAFPGL